MNYEVEVIKVYGQFHTTAHGPIDGIAKFTPRWRGIPIIKEVKYPVVNGILMGVHGPGIELPASHPPIVWDVHIAPINFKYVIESIPGETIALGD